MSFTDLKTSPDGSVQKTYKDAALKLGLLESDDEWDQCLSEAVLSFMPRQLCSLFVTILIFGEPVKPESSMETIERSNGRRSIERDFHVLPGVNTTERKVCR